MSGIVGIFERSLAPVSQDLLRAMTSSLSFRGPDAEATWLEGPVGLGHTMLRTTPETGRERPPENLDARFWITADARIDCQPDLIKAFEDAGHRPPCDATDAQLILHAYGVWKEGCVDHLCGDFAFAIWDRIEKRLFCARDHFGIKPFYYGEVGSAFVFSNTLNCVRLYPGISDELNDAAVLDFLILGLNCDNSATTFQAIRRLPPAHAMRVSASGVHLSRYWSPPTDGRIRYPQPEEYVDHFQSVFRAAVADRLRANRVGISLSGGLDSPSIAATARRAAPGVELRAYTVVYESLIQDHEGRFARQVADFLRIPIQLVPMDRVQPFERWEDPGTIWPEPVGDPFAAGLFDVFQAVVNGCGVLLNGHGGDDIMDFQMWPYARDLVRRREWRHLLTEVPHFLMVRQFPWRGLLRRTQRAFGKGPLAPIIPEWIAPQWAQAADMKNRWCTRTVRTNRQTHSVLPRAYDGLDQPQWTWLFETNDPGVTRVPVEVRYPFFDLRVVEYLLALPPFPWFFRKTLLRRAMLGCLPEGVRRRKKTPLSCDPLIAAMRRDAFVPFRRVQWSREMERYVDLSKLHPLFPDTSSERVRLETRPLCLNFWLRAVRTARYNDFVPCVPPETGNGHAQERHSIRFRKL